MASIDTVLYTAEAHASGGGTNPERLLAAGWSACFLGAMGRAADALRVELPADAAVGAEVGLGDTGDTLQARLNVSLPGLSRGAAEAVILAADQLCPYPEAVRGDVAVELNLI